ncbi:hypothetical protein PA7_25940 [Pseudonocardia asaccharolytica DSM 44247 = NBRC 16224]|uniref:Uncharacterized protein n=1 Tax=Pseudonocardia asaccharolytica DSM 44247 = NBRC 16224 TaxID=1123024 RepID=A0A511D243_9PSEU|nr:hypothetical protein PA7_25940 [Pseudonocardia asaccharolytica DSM 44247 = NBRC 16224]
MSNCRAPAAAASAATSSMPGVSITGSSSFGTVLVVGRNRVPRPAAGTTAERNGSGPGRADGSLAGTLMVGEPNDVGSVRV